MRFSTVFTTSALVSAAAASILTIRQDALPTCALPCIANAPTGDCGNNPGCLCKDQDFIASTTICIQNACTGQDLETAEKLSREQCEAVGVTLTQTSFSQTETKSSPASESTSSPANSSAGTTTGTGTSSTGAAGTTSNTAAQTSQTSPSSTGTAPATTSTGAASSSRTISTFALVGAVALGALAL